MNEKLGTIFMDGSIICVASGLITGVCILASAIKRQARFDRIVLWTMAVFLSLNFTIACFAQFRDSGLIGYNFFDDLQSGIAFMMIFFYIALVRFILSKVFPSAYQPLLLSGLILLTLLWVSLMSALSDWFYALRLSDEVTLKYALLMKWQVVFVMAVCMLVYAGWTACRRNLLIELTKREAEESNVSNKEAELVTSPK
jgi:hypothetical protein